MFARDLAKKSTDQDKNSALPNCIVVSLLDQSNPNLISTRALMDKCQRPMLITNQLISINPLNVSELRCIYLRGREGGPQRTGWL